MKAQFVEWVQGDRGATIVEYAMLITLIVVVVVALVGRIGDWTAAGYSQIEAGFH